MPVEFALRPRIRLREDPAPPRPARARLPKFALPALAYWLVIGGLVYAFVQHREPGPPLPETRLALVAHAPPSPPVVREWWRPLPAAPRQEPTALPRAEPEPQPDLPTALPAEIPEAQAQAQAQAQAEAEALPSPESSQVVATAPEPTLPPRRSRAFASEPAPQRAASLAPTSPPVATFSPEPPSDRIPETARPANPVVTSGSSSLPSCEAALASSSQDVDFSGGNRTADLPAPAIAAVLENGAWLNSCAVPEQTAIDVCVAIKGGRVVGASVTTRPPDATLANCVKRRAGSLQFPYSPRLDLARTRF